MQKGDEVILPSMTYVATAAAVVDAGYVPVLVDCDELGLIDAEVKCTSCARARVHIRVRSCVHSFVSGIACRCANV